MNNSTYHALRRLGWGFVLIMIDIHIMFLDILPDFIGYIMVATALHQLGAIHPVFRKAKWIAIIMIFLSLPSLIMGSNLSISEFSSFSIEKFLYSGGIMAIHMLMVYWIFNGLYSITKEIGGNAPLLDSISIRRNLYLALYVTQLFVYPFLLNVEESWFLLFIAFAVLSFIMEFLFLRLPFRVSRLISRSR